MNSKGKPGNPVLLNAQKREVGKNPASPCAIAALLEHSGWLNEILKEQAQRTLWRKRGGHRKGWRWDFRIGKEYGGIK